MSRGQRNGSLRSLIRFSWPEPLLFHLSSRGWVDPVPDPLFLRKSGSAGNRTRNLWIFSRKLWPLDHRGGQLNNIFNYCIYKWDGLAYFSAQQKLRGRYKIPQQYTQIVMTFLPPLYAFPLVSIGCYCHSWFSNHLPVLTRNASTENTLIIKIVIYGYRGSYRHVIQIMSVITWLAHYFTAVAVPLRLKRIFISLLSLFWKKNENNLSVCLIG
jgi:hypothetical protein